MEFLCSLLFSSHSVCSVRDETGHAKGLNWGQSCPNYWPKICAVSKSAVSKILPYTFIIRPHVCLVGNGLLEVRFPSMRNALTVIVQTDLEIEITLFASLACSPDAFQTIQTTFAFVNKRTIFGCSYSVTRIDNKYDEG